MKSKTTQRRIKASKGSSCAMCKPWKHGWEGKRTVNEARKAHDADQQLRELEPLGQREKRRLAELEVEKANTPDWMRR